MIDIFTKSATRQRGELEELFDIDPDGVYLPSREEIVRECAAIRSHWSEREHRKRSVEKVALRWRPPTIHVEQDAQYYLSE